MKKLICLVFCSLFVFAGCKNASYFEVVEASKAAEEESSQVESSDTTGSIATATKTIFVQVAGQVIKPGVYELQEDSRVFQAIEAAGGLSPLADDTDINMAQLLSDGEKIYVFSQDERLALQAAGAEAEKNADDGLVNINLASAEELCSLPGIGQSKANLIVAYRESNGDFSSIEDIKNVSGIGDGIYRQIQDYIKTK